MDDNKTIFFMFHKDWFDEESQRKKYEYPDQSYTQFLDDIVLSAGIDLEPSGSMEQTGALIQYPSGDQRLIPDVLKCRNEHLVISDYENKVYQDKYVISVLKKSSDVPFDYYESLKRMKDHPAFDDVNSLMMLVGEVDHSAQQCKTC